MNLFRLFRLKMEKLFGQRAWGTLVTRIRIRHTQRLARPRPLTETFSMRWVRTATLYALRPLAARFDGRRAYARSSKANPTIGLMRSLRWLMAKFSSSHPEARRRRS